MPVRFWAFPRIEKIPAVTDSRYKLKALKGVKPIPAGSPTDPLDSLHHPAEEDLSVPSKNVSLNYKIVLFLKLCQKSFDIMVTGFSFSVAKLKNLSMCILNLLKNMQNFGLIQFCWLNPMDI